MCNGIFGISRKELTKLFLVNKRLKTLKKLNN